MADLPPKSPYCGKSPASRKYLMAPGCSGPRLSRCAAAGSNAAAAGCARRTRSECAQIALALRLLRFRHAGDADALVGIETAGARPLDSHAGRGFTVRRGFDGKRGAFVERFARKARFDPLDARIAAFVVDDLRNPAAIGSPRLGAVFVVI